mgnify:CR=1 FL=1
MTTFTAEIIEIKAKKLASGDKSFRLILETDQDITELQKYIAEAIVKVEIKEQ